MYAFKYLFFKQEKGPTPAILSDKLTSTSSVFNAIHLFSKGAICAMKVSRDTQKKAENQKFNKKQACPVRDEARFAASSR